MFNSGNRIVNQNKVNVGADSALAANQRDVDDATAELAGARQVASNQRTTGTAGIQASTAARQGATYVDNWRRTNNIGA
jgi:F0F1-type ATP synthase epsilon subunit